MRACWKILAASLCAGYAMAASVAAHSAEIAFSSQADFTEINLNIKDTYNANPDILELEVTLSPDAQQRMQAASNAALDQDLTFVINGKAVNTSRVRNVLDTPQLQIMVSRQAAIELLPGLLGVNAGSPAPDASITTTPVIPTPGPASIPAPLLAAAPIAVQTQPVVSPSVTESVPEIAAMPAAAAAEATTVTADPAAPPATPPAAPSVVVPTAAATVPAAVPVVATAVAASASDLMPSATAQETATAPVVVALPPPPPPVIPGWALGAWLPTSATPTQYADINAGDPVTIMANALDAITCNKARLSVLENSNGRVLLQMARNSQCVIGGVLIDRVQITPSVTAGRIVISFFAQQDDLNGTPAKQGVYRRK